VSSLNANMDHWPTFQRLLA